MTRASMYIGYLEAPTQGNPELSEEENTALRLKRAQRALEPVDLHYRRRLAFNIARLSVVEQSVTILDGPALSPDSKLTGDDSESPGLPPQAAISPPAEDCPGFQPGLALTVGKLCVPRVLLFSLSFSRSFLVPDASPTHLFIDKTISASILFSLSSKRPLFFFLGINFCLFTYPFSFW